jgi:tetratricopeptide (TPR) repeat protein
VPNLITLTCPSCNGQLELPDNLGVAHCMYCGTKILLQQPDTTNEKVAIQRYKELCKTALESKNYTEVIQFSNSILELDPKDADAWIDKAIATFWLTSYKNNRYDEAMEYLKKAAQLSPANNRMFEVRLNLTHEQAMWYNVLGTKHNEFAAETWNRFIQISAARANEESKEYFISAMEYFMTASKYAPDDEVILGNIRECSKQNPYIEWSNNVHEKINTSNLLQKKKEAEESLPKICERSIQLNAELNELRLGNGIFNKKKTKDLEDKIQEIKAEIAQKEQALAYQRPEKLKFDW